MKTLYLFTDGGARGNPGPAAIGIVLRDPEGNILAEQGKKIGRATNNQAEYTAIINGLRLARKHEPQNLICLLDSLLVVNQLNGRFKLKNAGLRELFLEVQKELARMKETRVEFRYIPREKNVRADQLLNQALSNSRTG